MEAPAFFANGFGGGALRAAYGARIGQDGGALFQKANVFALPLGEVAEVFGDSGERGGLSDLYQFARGHGEMMPSLIGSCKKRRQVSGDNPPTHCAHRAGIGSSIRKAQCVGHPRLNLAQDDS